MRPAAVKGFGESPEGAEEVLWRRSRILAQKPGSAPDLLDNIPRLPLHGRPLSLQVAKGADQLLPEQQFIARALQTQLALRPHPPRPASRPAIRSCISCWV